MYYNSWNRRYKNPFGAAETESCIEFSVKEEKKLDIFLIIKCEDKFWQFKLNHSDNDDTYDFKWNVPQKTALYWYYFEIHDGGKIYYYGNNMKEFGGEGLIYSECPKPYQITVYKKGSAVPDWFTHGIIYQIFVDRFFNGNDDNSAVNPRPSIFFKRNWNELPGYIKDESGKVIKYDFYGGNIKGIIKKIPYLKSLNVTILYLNPVFKAFSNHKYDTSDYKSIDEMYGNEEIFKKLCSECKKAGIKIILDGVFNHTGSDSIYFNKNGTYAGKGAYQSADSPYYEWYTFDKYPDEYKTWWGIQILPVLSKKSESLRKFLLKDEDSVIHHWMKCGVSGWRLDVADELPDDFIKELKSECRTADSESAVIGEVWEDASNKISYGTLRQYFLGDELDSVMNYPLRDILVNYVLGKITGTECIIRMNSLKENYPEPYFYSTMNLIGTHDVPRILTVLGGGNFPLLPCKREEAVKKLKMLVMAVMTLPGVPSIYYGDEAGAEGQKDPSNRGTYPWEMENTEILDWYKNMISLRMNNNAFIEGRLEFIYSDDNAAAYIREDKDGESFLILFNNSENEITISIPLRQFIGMHCFFTDILNLQNIECISKKLVISIQGWSGRILKIEKYI